MKRTYNRRLNLYTKEPCLKKSAFSFSKYFLQKRYFLYMFYSQWKQILHEHPNSRLSLFVSPIYTSFLFVVNILMMGFFSQKSVYTNMNVWTHYLYWSDRYPTGPNDEKCAGHSRAKSKISVSEPSSALELKASNVTGKQKIHTI